MFRRPLTSFLTLLLYLFLPWAVQAQEVYRHPESHLVFPAKLGDFERGEVKTFDDPRMGISVGYRAPGLGWINVYLFTAGFQNIPDGVAGKPVRDAYAWADKDVRDMVERGTYLDFKQVLPMGSRVRMPASVEWHTAAYHYRPNVGKGEPVASWLLVRGIRGQIAKIRYTSPDSGRGRGLEDIDGFIKEFATVNQL